MYAIGRFESFISSELEYLLTSGLIWPWFSDGDDLDKFAAEETAMDTTTAAADDSSAASKSQAVESLREVEGEEKPPGEEEEEDWLTCIYLKLIFNIYNFKPIRHQNYKFLLYNIDGLLLYSLLI